MRESGLRARIVKALRARGWLVLPQYSSGMSGSSRSDLLVCAAGHFIAIEIKTDTGKTTPGQDAFLEKVRHHKGGAFVARSTTDAIAGVQEHLMAKTRDELDDLFDDLEETAEGAIFPAVSPIMDAAQALADADDDDMFAYNPPNVTTTAAMAAQAKVSPTRLPDDMAPLTTDDKLDFLADQVSEAIELIRALVDQFSAMQTPVVPVTKTRKPRTPKPPPPEDDDNDDV